MSVNAVFGQNLEGQEMKNLPERQKEVDSSFQVMGTASAHV